jgi:hypothetical protein
MFSNWGYTKHLEVQQARTGYPKAATLNTQEPKAGNVPRDELLSRSTIDNIHYIRKEHTNTDADPKTLPSQSEFHRHSREEN